MLESSIEQVFADRVRELGGMSFKFAPIVAGNPDRIVLLPGGRAGQSGRVVLVELKAIGGKLSSVQKLWHRRAARLGVHVSVVTGSEEARSWVPPE